MITDENYAVKRQEVLIDIAVNAGSLIEQERITVINSRAMNESISELADSFMTVHRDTDWEDTDYLEAIDAFAEVELTGLFGS